MSVKNTQDPVFPVIEIFGPVIEGEGALAGKPTTFIRFGYCDFRCLWCDSMHAVEPEQVKANAEWLTAEEIFERTTALTQGYRSITFSGGNPVLHDLTKLVTMFKTARYQIKVETQGTIWRDWLKHVSHIVISPKPPSSGMIANLKVLSQYEQFCRNIRDIYVETTYKFVVFDEADLIFARTTFEHLSTISNSFDMGRRGIWLSCGTKNDDTRDTLGERYAWLCDAALKRFAGRNYPITVLPQLHVVAYLHKLGV